MTVNSQSDGNGNTWIIALVSLCLGIIGYGALYSTNAVSDPAYIAGEYLVYALVIWGAFYVVFLKKRGNRKSFTAFVAIYMALFASGLVAAQKQKQEAMQAVSSIQREFNRIAPAPTDSNEFSTPIQSVAPQAGAVKGEFSEMQRFMKEFIDRMLAQRNDYALELEAIGWNSILDAKRVKHDVNLTESRVMVEKAKTLVEKYEKKTAELMRNTRMHIDSLNISETAKKNMLAGFESSMRKSRQRIDEQWSLEKQVVLQVENIFFMLAASKKWLVEDDHILFYSEGELARYNSYMQAIQDLAQRQEQIQNSSFSDANKQMESLKNALQR